MPIQLLEYQIATRIFRLERIKNYCVFLFDSIVAGQQSARGRYAPGLTKSECLPYRQVNCVVLPRPGIVETYIDAV